MLSWGHHISLLATFLCLTTAQDWGYEDPAQWGATFPECNGRQQSPIALDSSETRSPWWRFQSWIDDSSIDLLDYDEPASATFTNNGHTVNMVYDYSGTDGSSRPRTVITNHGTSSIYNFRSLHFHWPAEHPINGEKFPLEMHLVHVNPEDDSILVLGYVFQESHQGCGNPRSGMRVIESAVQRLVNPMNSVNITQFSPGRIMPGYRGICGYFSYEGSLTTPPCTEGVRWLVREEPLCITREQMGAFNRVNGDSGEPMRGNTRPIQPINGREVNFYPCWVFF